MDNVFSPTHLTAIRIYMTANRHTLAVAESVTAGLLQTALASATDASRFFQGGMTAYNLGQKSRLLSVEPIHAMECNCVSEQVAAQMALHICDVFGSNWGIGITGYAVPVPESGNKVHAYYAVAHNNKIVIEEHVTPEPGDSLQVQLRYVNHLLETLGKHLGMQAIK